MIKKSISIENWSIAQTEEIKHHICHSLEYSDKFYGKMYEYYFKYLDINNEDLKGKTILEIGPARMSALLYCKNYGDSHIVEPIKYEGVDCFYSGTSINFIRESYETCDSPVVDEIWLLNVMQHIMDPDIFIEKAKKSAKVIKFFEPIDEKITLYHPHTYSKEDYESYFGDCVKLYSEKISEFHTAKCVYGIYNCIK